MVTFLGLSDNICALIICAVAGVNFLNACIVARYSRQKGIASTDCGTALVFFVALCTGMLSWLIFCCDCDSSSAVNVNGVRVISLPAPYSQPSYGHYQQFHNAAEHSMQGQLRNSYQPPIQPPPYPPASYYVQQPAPVAAHDWNHVRTGAGASLLQASAPPLDS